MKFLKDYWPLIFIAVVLYLFADNIYSRIFGHRSEPQGTPPEVQMKLDSITKANTTLEIDKAVLKKELENAFDKLNFYENKIMKISERYHTKIIEYRDATPEGKKKIIEVKVKHLQGEMGK